ncbi:MAG TPA: hypothetical protein VJZ00_24240, partial [Thermoanaerobaculia bacterium]|nr:hypothetical protein [Thermoanaerobaculia bacterium]
MHRLRIVVLLALTLLTLTSQSQTTTKNDDSCDVMVAPAATLLLPYFEVDLASPTGETTLFTVTNVGALPQIAHVTLWTDAAFPVLDFNIFLTGYDVQSINLYDVIARGRIAEPGTSHHAHTGDRSKPNDANPLLDLTNCDRLAVFIPDSILLDMQRALTLGRSSRCAPDARVGGTHLHAIGYATIDVVASCGTTLPTDPDYASKVLLYDNVLSGDYQQVYSANNFAQAAPMVHIRAFPEGGAPGAKTTNLKRTFYSSMQTGGATADRRQPLPSTFAARWISGGSVGFNTTYKIWREAPRRVSACAVSQNLTLPIGEFVRFDEEENPTTRIFECPILCPPDPGPQLPATSSASVADLSLFPLPEDGAIAGWVYMNLDNAYIENPGPFPSQNWVITTMRAEGRYSVDMEASALGNGCSAIAPITDEERGLPAIAPAPNAREVFATGSPATTGNDDSCDVANLPAATLLLPYFEVDLTSQSGETTLFTVTNVTRLPQIAHVTLWSDWSYPVLSFDLFLTGYDMQSVNLYDVIQRGILPNTPTDARRGRRSADISENALVNFGACSSVVNLPDATREQVRRALTIGVTSACGTRRIGGLHTNATGFVTIDVAQRCGGGFATDNDYFTRVATHDNVFIGDFQQVNSFQNFAQGNPMVHIRAVPEGLGTGSTNMARTFY